MKKDIFAIYFPSWHPDKHYEKWYGKGFSEWELVKTTKPLFEGHLQPKKPLLGYFDESSPEWMQRQIDLAADNGITGFIFDWYWYDGVQFLEKPLDEAFLNAPNRNRLKFSLMWANHTWGVWPALDDDSHQGMNGNTNHSSTIHFHIKHSEQDLRNVIDFCCKKYFKCENYWKIDGKPVFSYFNSAVLFKSIPPEDVVRIMDEVAQKNGFPGIYRLMNIGCCNDNEYFCGWGRIPELKKAGFDSVFAYNSGLKNDYETLPRDRPTFDFSIFRANQEHCWKMIAAGGLPFFPSITLGDDVSPRWNRKIKFPWDYEKLGYYPICVNNTPERFGEMLKNALAMDTTAVIINAWNEWTEGMYLLPEEHYGYGYLDQIRLISQEQHQ